MDGRGELQNSSVWLGVLGKAVLFGWAVQVDRAEQMPCIQWDGMFGIGMSRATCTCGQVASRSDVPGAGGKE
jgi:hypothetical protein